MSFKTFRYALKSALAGWRVPIRSGPLRGCRISLFSGSRFVRGTYDGPEIDALLAQLMPGDVFYDVGAHIGYYGMAVARRVGAAGRVYAFEPLPLNLKMLRGHVAANRMENIEVIAAGVSAAPGETFFDLAGGTGRGRLGAKGELRVPLVSIDDLVASGRARPPSLIKMDIEGAELLALQGARQTLLQYHPQILLSVHSEALRESCSQLLVELGYALLPARKSNQILASGQTQSGSGR